MNKIIKNYNSLVKKYKEIEKDSTEQEIHDKRVTLRRIFPILAVSKISSSKVKNGEKAFKLFGKLRDVQVQKLKLEKTEKTPEMIEYLAYLNEQELKLQEKVRKFCKNKKLVFPVIKKAIGKKSKIYSKTDKLLNKLVEKVQLNSIDDAMDIHKIRIEFKKFRYMVEILSYIDKVDVEKFEKLKMYQDELGEIQDYEILIKGITKFYKKRKLNLNIELFEKEQDVLIENFDSELELFIAVCRDVVLPTNDVDSWDIDEIGLGEELSLNDNQMTENADAVDGVDDQISENIDAVGLDDEQPIEATDAANSTVIKAKSRKKKSDNDKIPVESE